MKIKGDDVFFETTGRKFYANCGVIGLDNPGKSGDWRVWEGYDGWFDDPELTREEKIELADYMIALWGKFKNA